jgi:hypothetical protein
VHREHRELKLDENGRIKIKNHRGHRGKNTGL